MVKRKKFKRSIVSLLAITLMLITFISPLNSAHAATSSDGQYSYATLEDGTIKLTGYLGFSRDISIPSKIDGYNVTVIDDNSFKSKNITSIIIPNSIKKIGSSAFESNSLSSVAIPDSVTDIGEYAFISNNISSATIGNGVKTIGNSAFGSNYLTYLKLGKNVESIGNRAFFGSSLAALTLPNYLKTIGDEAFSRNKITEVIIPSSVESIGQWAFAYNKITKFTVKNPYTLYGTGVLSSNTDLGYNSLLKVYGYKNSTSEAMASSNENTFVPFTADEGATYAVEGAESSLNQSDVDSARDLVNTLPSGTVKDDLIARLDVVQNKIDQQQTLANATAAVEQAESSKNANDVIVAQGLVNALEDGTDKTNLQTRLDAVQDAINKQQAENDATTAVEQAESSHSQADVDHANDLVNALPDGTVKADLLDRIDTVQTTIDEAGQGDQQAEDDATAAVEQAESSHSQSDVDHANDLVNALPDGTVKDSLLDRIHAVQTAIDGDNEENETEPGSTTATNDVDFTLEGGELSLANSEVVSFGTIKLSEQPKSYSTSFTDHFTVKDLTGNQLGYRVDVSATPFTDGKNILPKGTLSLKPVSAIEKVGTGTSTAPVSSLSSNQIIDNGKVTLVSAATGTGMGVYNLTFPDNALSIAVDPTTAKIDGASSTYQSTITWDLIQAP